MSTLFISLSVAMIGGLMMSRIAKKLNLPAVTAYLIAGLLLGPYCLGQLHIQGIGFNTLKQVESLNMISQAAMGFIAFTIGNEFRLSQLKSMGKQAIIIGILQAVVTTIVVDIGLIALHFAFPSVISLSSAITLGAIASATAPAATLMVVRQYKAKGPLTDLLLPIVALDDAVGLVIFSVSFGVARAIESGKISVISMIVNPIIEVTLSLLLGALMGWVFTACEKIFHSGSKRMSLSISFVLLTVALSMIKIELGEVHIGFSSLLVCMMLGTVFCNLCDFSADIMDRADKWTAPLFVMFFVLSGAELRLDILADVWVLIIGAVYIVFRSLGKYFGALSSAVMTKCSPEICRYLGITLLPQAGVALGMCATAMQLGEQGNLIRNITLFAVLVYELFGPVLTRMALTAAGEIHPIPDDVKERRTAKLNAAKEMKKTK